MSRLWRVWMSPPGGASMTTSARRAPRSAVTTWRSCLTSRGVRLPSISTVWQSWGCSRSPTDAAPDAPARARAAQPSSISVRLATLRSRCRPVTTISPGGSLPGPWLRPSKPVSVLVRFLTGRHVTSVEPWRANGPAGRLARARPASSWVCWRTTASCHGPWHEAVVLQQTHEDAGRARASRPAGPFARHGSTEVTCLPVKNLTRTLTGLLGLSHGPGKEPPGEIVVTERQRDRNVASRTLIELGWAARARAGASGAASVGDREQPQLCQTVEMEGSRTPRDVKHDRHVVTADRGALRADVVIDAPPGGLIQTRHSRDIRRGARGHLTSGPTRGGGMHSWRHDLHPYTEFLVDETPTLSSNVNVTRF